MRRWLLAAVPVALCGCGVIDLPAKGYAGSGWRTSTGAPLSTAEVEALRHLCAPDRVTERLDPDRPVASPLRDNPLYRPGGEGLVNAPATGIAAAHREIEPGTRRVAPLGAIPMDRCLREKGVVREQ